MSSGMRAQRVGTIKAEAPVPRTGGGLTVEEADIVSKVGEPLVPPFRS